MALRVRVFDIQFPPASELLDRDEEAVADALIAGIGEGGQVSRGRPVEGGQGVKPGGGDVVH